MTTVKTSARRVRADRVGDANASRIVAQLEPGTRVVGLTNGEFSLLNLVRCVLERIGPADVTIATWSAGLYDTDEVHRLLASGKLRSLRWILDRSFSTRQAGYAAILSDLFPAETIRTTNLHAKFVLIRNETRRVAIRSSMNLNENRRCELFEVDDDPAIYDLLDGFAADLFGAQPEGLVESRAVVDPVFDNLFQRPPDPEAALFARIRAQMFGDDAPLPAKRRR